MKRDIFSMPLDLGHELVIDNFAGGGGASTGIAMGLGREVDVAINHDGEALAMHAAKPLSKTSQVRMIGNSVVPQLAAALVSANFRHEQQLERAA